MVVVAPAAPASNGDGKRRGIIIGAAVVAVLAALVAVLMVTGVIGPKSLAGANAVQASSVTRIVPQSANGARIVQYTATLYDDAGKTVASVDVSNSSGFTMSDFKAPELKKGSYTIDIRDKQTNTS